MRPCLLFVFVAALLATSHADVGAQTPAGYSLALPAATDSPTPIAGVGTAQNLVGPGTQITYTIKHTERATLQIVYQFITPLGTTFVSARAISGARIIETEPFVKGASPVGQGGVFVKVEPTAVSGSVAVTVRVNDIWQGTVSAQAYFLATGL